MTASFNQRGGIFIPPAHTMPSMTAGAALLAHQGGWDEMLLVVGPIIFIVVVLGIVKRRVDRTQQPPPT